MIIIVNLVARRIRQEWILGSQQRTADNDANQNKIAPVRVGADLVANLSETVKNTHEAPIYAS